MKLRQNKEFPYPVLSPYTDDYVNSTYSNDVSGSIIGYKCVLRLKTSLTDDVINQMIESGQAVLIYHIECSQTGYREVFHAPSFDVEHKIPLRKLRGNVEVNSFVIANCEIKNYQNDNLNEDYQGYSIKFEKGFILAEGEEFDLGIPRKYTDLKEKNNPFVTIVPIKDKEVQTIKVDLNKQKIMVLVPEKVSINYAVAQQTYKIRPVLFGMFIIPALYQGLLKLKKSDDVELAAMEDLLWVQSMEDLLRTTFKKKIDDIRNMDDQDLYVLAQQLLDSPIPKASDFLVARGEGEA